MATPTHGSDFVDPHSALDRKPRPTGAVSGAINSLGGPLGDAEDETVRRHRALFPTDGDVDRLTCTTFPRKAALDIHEDARGALRAGGLPEVYTTTRYACP